MAANFARGNPQMVPYTPTDGDKSPGDIVVLGNTAGITTGVIHHAITNNTPGEIAIGGGIYEMTALSNTDPYVAAYVDAANTSFDGAANTGQLFGYTVETAVANTVSEVLHSPIVEP